MENTNSSPNRKLTMILTILVVVLAASLGVLYMQYQKKMADNAIVQDALEEQKESLTSELKDMMSEYEGLKSDNDSLNNQIDKQQGRIKNLLSINASNLEKIKLYKKELATLREVMKSYIVQIDSLNTKNQKLVADNTEVKTALDDARKNNEDLSKEKADMSTKIETAKVLSAKNITVSPLNRRGKDTEKATRTAKIKASFTIRENSLAAAGEKTIYMRITRPDELVLASSEQDVFEYDGNKIVYSAKRQVTYQNSDLDVSVYWDNAGELITGTYNVDLFCEGKLIGSSTFSLR